MHDTAHYSTTRGLTELKRLKVTEKIMNLDITTLPPGTPRDTYKDLMDIMSGLAILKLS